VRGPRIILSSLIALVISRGAFEGGDGGGVVVGDEMGVRVETVKVVSGVGDGSAVAFGSDSDKFSPSS
jgi:hypothetical protein